jgi:molecular chaperone GrpE (heat shock protein)
MSVLQAMSKGWKAMDENEKVEPPPIADIPKPELPPATEKTDEQIFGEAAVMLHRIKQAREAAQQREQQLQVELTETVLARQGDAKKIEFLELENAELRNNIATLQSEIEDYRASMAKMKEIFDRFGIKPPEKKTRNGNGNGNHKKAKP